MKQACSKCGTEGHKSSTCGRDGRRCSVCKQNLPLDRFQTIRVKDKRSGYEYCGPAWECRECRKEQRREWRRKKAQEAGRTLLAPGEWQARQKAVAERRKAERLAKRKQQRAQLEAQRGFRREELAMLQAFRCSTCGTVKPRSEFWESQLLKSIVRCAECAKAFEAAKFQRNKDAISDDYVKRQLSKHTGLRRADIPRTLIEAKRIQLMIDRVVPRDDVLFQVWLKRTLGAEPIDAEQLNRMAKDAGFNTRKIELRRARRIAGAIHDSATNTWRIA